MEWSELAQDMDKSWVSVNIMMDIWVLFKAAW
jgi:hypothetical protein